MVLDDELIPGELEASADGTKVLWLLDERIRSKLETLMNALHCRIKENITLCKLLTARATNRNLSIGAIGRLGT